MTPYEIMLSESQERMLLVVKHDGAHEHDAAAGRRRRGGAREGNRPALALTSDVTPRIARPIRYEGGKQAVAEAARNIAVSGGRPLAITDNV
jgi:phosphoribosylformylglycinamidine (FGAM) synthase-like enzyme